MLDAMFGARGLACCLMVWAAGCLAAPPAADDESLGPTCEPILEGRFAWAAAPDESDLEVTEMAWAACER